MNTGNYTEHLVINRTTYKSYKQELQDRKTWFKHFFKRHQKNLKALGEKYSTKELALKCAISYESFRKLVYMARISDKRDFVIMLCALLQVTDPEEINNALRVYNYFAPLSMEDGRDALLMELLDQQLDDPKTIEEFNRELQANEMPKLEYGAETIDKNDREYPYTIVNKSAETFFEDLPFNKYDSLDAEYDPAVRYSYLAKMEIMDTSTNERFLLSYDGRTLSRLRIIHDEFALKHFESLEDTGEFQPYFKSLHALLKSERNRSLSFLENADNYPERYSVNYRNNGLHAFIETRNYAIPERKEYFFFEYIDGKYILTISDSSLFMFNYLLPNDYKHYYGTNPPVKGLSFESEEAIIGYFESIKTNSLSDEYLKGIYIQAYKKMRTKVKDILCKIAKKQIYIRRLDFSWDDTDRVCEFFNVQKEFDCVIHEPEYENFMVANKNSAVFTVENGNTVTVTMSDLRDAFELGFNTIEEICWVKAKYKSIREVIPSEIIAGEQF